jgi:hypothetical protein
VLDRTVELSVLWVLNKVYGESEQDVSLEAAKQRIRRRVYGAQYLRLAEKYFGARMNTDARRCYLQAMRNQPGIFLRTGILRRLLATMTSRRLYESTKRLLRFESN